jgi:hypothetical protein
MGFHASPANHAAGQHRASLWRQPVRSFRFRGAMPWNLKTEVEQKETKVTKDFSFAG